MAAPWGTRGDSVKGLIGDDFRRTIGPGPKVNHF